MLKKLFTRKSIIKLDKPKINITKDLSKTLKQLKSAEIEYKKVIDGYISFPAKLFGYSETLIVGIHYSLNDIQFLEIFRPKEYYLSPDYNIQKSYDELSTVLKKRLGTPSKEESYDNDPFEEWILYTCKIQHYIFDRFGLEEHLQIYF